MQIVLGLDGGGTKTEAVILDEERRELGRGAGGPCNIATCDDAAVRESVTMAAAMAAASAGLPRDVRLASVCAAVAGYTARNRRIGFRSILQDSLNVERIRIEPDFVAACWGAAGGAPGIAVISGTGAAVYGRSADGREARMDGRGFLLGDAGSAFDVGARTAKELIRRLDRGEPLTSLDKRLLRAIGAADADDLVEWTYRPFRPSKIADLARAVGSSADEGDADARRILESAAADLYQSIEWVANRIGAEPGMPVYALGGHWKASDYFQTALLAASSRGSFPISALSQPLRDPAYGAALLALQSPA